MAINSVSYANSSLGQAVLNINNQLTSLSTQLASGEKSTTYAGMGVNEGFAVAARSQLASISAFTDTMTNINTTIGVANTALQALVNIGTTVQNSASASSQTLNGTGQSIGQQTALSQLSSMLGVLNTQSGDRYVFSGSAINTPSVDSTDAILNGTTSQAGLKQVMAQRLQADQGTGTPPTGRLVVSTPVLTPTVVNVAEDVAGSPFGLKLNSVSSTLTGATVTGPAGSPAAVSIDLGGTNPSPGDQVSFTFNLPDGTTDSFQLTATTTNPPPAGSFLIDPPPSSSSTNTAVNLKAALTTAISTIANTSMVAASAIEAGSDFFGSDGAATGTVVNNKAATPAPIAGATALSGLAGTDSLATNFAPGNSITVNGTPITFVASGATGNQLNVTDSVQTLLAKIDSISGTSTPSTVSGGVVTLQSNGGAPLTVTSSNAAAFAALGFSAGTPTATTGPLRVSGTPLGTATTLVSGTPANTVSWYTGNPGPVSSARASSTARIDASVSVQYGMQADEPAIRSQLRNLAVFAAFTASPTGTNSAAQIEGLSQRVAQNLTPQPSQQSIQDIQTDLSIAQTTMKDAGDRQTQAQSMLQNIVDTTENVSTAQVASQILALQNSLQASYQTTSMLSQLTLTKYLPIG
jgi:flagellar hook-associated protein 3 FlgL